MEGAGVEVADRSGFSEYVAARRPLMFRTAWMLCADAHQAEDLVQHVLTRLYVGWPRISRMESADGYVRTMLVHANVDRLRRRRDHVGLDGFDLAAREVDHDALLDLRAALADLAPGQKRVVVLRHLWGLEEIARIGNACCAPRCTHAGCVGVARRAPSMPSLRSLAIARASRRSRRRPYPRDLSVEETAAELGIAPGTVKSQTADAVRRLRELLAPQRSEGPRP